MPSSAGLWLEPFSRTVPVLEGRTVWMVFGVGSLDKVGAEARALGRRALLVTGHHEGAAADVVSRQLGADLVGQLNGAAEHVSVQLAAEAAGRARDLRAEVLIAVGGGSATGLAKAVALETGLSILAIPTTYAGSEMTPIWGLTDEAGKRTGRDARVLPRTVIYDPSLTRSLPPDVTAASGMNALAHAVEALYAADATPALSAIAETAIAALAAALPLAVAHPDDLDARAHAMYGAWLAGWALGSATMGLHHKLAHVLGGTYGLPHAGTHSALLPHVAAYNAHAAGPGFIRAARAFGVGGPEDVGPALFDLATRLAAPTSLAGLGLDHRAIEQVAATVAAGDVASPRPITEGGLIRLLRDAYAGNRPGTLANVGSSESRDPPRRPEEPE